MKLKKFLTESILAISDKDGELERRKLKFTKNNIKKIASHYDAAVQKIELDLKHAVLKDDRGRLLFVDEVFSNNFRRRKK